MCDVFTRTVDLYFLNHRSTPIAVVILTNITLSIICCVIEFDPLRDFMRRTKYYSNHRTQFLPFRMGIATGITILDDPVESRGKLRSMVGVCGGGWMVRRMSDLHLFTPAAPGDSTGIRQTKKVRSNGLPPPCSRYCDP